MEPASGSIWISYWLGEFYLLRPRVCSGVRGFQVWPQLVGYVLDATPGPVSVSPPKHNIVEHAGIFTHVIRSTAFWRDSSFIWAASTQRVSAGLFMTTFPWLPSASSVVSLFDWTSWWVHASPPIFMGPCVLSDLCYVECPSSSCCGTDAAPIFTALSTSGTLVQFPDSKMVALLSVRPFLLAFRIWLT